MLAGRFPFELRKNLLDAIYDFDGVCAGLPLDVQDHGGRLVHSGCLSNDFYIVDNVRHISHQHRSAIAKCNY